MSDYLQGGRLCTVYRSGRVDEMYLYVDRKEGLQRVPEALLERFGAPQRIMEIWVREGKSLARTEPVKVLEALAEKGFYLQMPPPREPYMYIPNDKLSRG